MPGPGQADSGQNDPLCAFHRAESERDHAAQIESSSRLRSDSRPGLCRCSPWWHGAVAKAPGRSAASRPGAPGAVLAARGPCPASLLLGGPVQQAMSVALTSLPGYLPVPRDGPGGHPAAVLISVPDPLPTHPFRHVSSAASLPRPAGVVTIGGKTSARGRKPTGERGHPGGGVAARRSDVRSQRR